MNVEKAEEERIFLQSSRVVLAMLKSYETRNQQNEEQTLVIGDDQDCPEAHQRGATWVLPVLCLYAVSPLSDRIYGTVTVRYGPKPYNTVKMKVQYSSGTVQENGRPYKLAWPPGLRRVPACHSKLPSQQLSLYHTYS